MSDIHAKIANLLDLANNNPSEEEAATAFNMARRLMLKHNIDERDLNQDFGSIEKFADGPSVDRDYFKLLAGGIGELIPARAVISTNGRKSRIKWAATPVNAQIADDLLLFWAEQVEKLYKIHLPRGMSKSERARYRTDFKRNCAVGIIQRAREIRKLENQQAGVGNALVVVEDKLMAEVDEFMAKQKLGRGRAMSIRGNTVGAAHGRQAAGSVQMQRGLGG